MKIGVLGTGNVGGTLGRLWAQRGHQVVFGTREPRGEKARALLEAAPGARAASTAEAAAWGEVVVLATPWAAAHEVVRAAGDLQGKILVDCTNAVGPGFTPGAQPSAAQQVAGWAPGARVVKAFNTVGYNVLVDPRFGEVAAGGFLCGDDPEAKDVVGGLARELGFDVVDCGPLARAALLESLALLWISLSVQGMGREIAFTLLRR
jgi:NADPH-dependent F420 reductase